MEFIPICLECDHFRNGDKCKHYPAGIPHSIKNRVKECTFFSGGEYDLFIQKPKKKEKTQSK